MTEILGERDLLPKEKTENVTYANRMCDLALEHGVRRICDRCS